MTTLFYENPMLGALECAAFAAKLLAGMAGLLVVGLNVYLIGCALSVRLSTSVRTGKRQAKDGAKKRLTEFVGATVQTAMDGALGIPLRGLRAICVGLVAAFLVGLVLVGRLVAKVVAVLKKTWPLVALLLLTGCVGDNLADIAQAQAAAEAARAAQEAAQAANTAAAGLSMAVIAPWVIAILLTVTVVGWVWATYILPAMRGQQKVAAPRMQRMQRPQVQERFSQWEQPRQLPAPKDEPLSFREVWEMKMMEKMMGDERRRDDF